MAVRCFVYVFACRDYDLLKIGFSREPLRRLQTFHPRYFEFFDLQRSLLIETDRLRDARRIEREFLATYVEQRAEAPLQVPRSAAGHTEWFAGVHPLAVEQARALCDTSGFRLHYPARNWLRSEFAARIEMLFDWSDRSFEQIQYLRFNASPVDAITAERVLRDVLDAYFAFEIPLQEKVTERVFNWYQNLRNVAVLR